MQVKLRQKLQQISCFVKKQKSHLGKTGSIFAAHVKKAWRKGTRCCTDRRGMAAKAIQNLHPSRGKTAIHPKMTRKLSTKKCVGPFKAFWHSLKRHFGQTNANVQKPRTQHSSFSWENKHTVALSGPATLNARRGIYYHF